MSGELGVAFRLLSVNSLSEEGFARRVVDTIFAAPKELRPKRFGTFQPDRPIDSPEEVLDLLLNRRTAGHPLRAGSVILAADKGLQYSLQWNMGSGSRFSSVSGHCDASDSNGTSPMLAALLQQLSILSCTFRVAYGEARAMWVPGWDLPFDLTVRLPDVPNVMILGPEYVALFGLQQVATAPVVDVKLLCDDTYWLRIAESLTTRVPEGTRSAVRAHLGESAFMANGRSRYKDGSAPRFAFPEAW